MRIRPLVFHTLLVASALTAQVASAADAEPALRKQPATASVAPASTQILGAALAGRRMVAVGVRGVVLLSDDDGKTWHQAKSVPVRSALNAVVFTNDKQGWAVGHDGAIIATADGGDTWQLQRFDASVDQPLFSVAFIDAKRGVAVGLWSLVLTTADGGEHWNPVKLPPPPDGGKSDRNLYKAFSDGKGTVYVAAEKGTVLSSTDGGVSWTYHDTGYKGSLWTGIATPAGDLLVGGLRGSLYRSRDHGKSWQALVSGSKSSLTDIAVTGEEVVAVGLDGTVATSKDGGASFTVAQRDDRAALTTLLHKGSGQWQMFSKQGVVAP